MPALPAPGCSEPPRPFWPASISCGFYWRWYLYHYRSDRVRHPHGIDQQIAKAEKAVAGQAAVKRNRLAQLLGGSRRVNRTLEAQEP